MNASALLLTGSLLGLVLGNVGFASDSGEKIIKETHTEDSTIGTNGLAPSCQLSIGRVELSNGSSAVYEFHSGLCAGLPNGNESQLKVEIEAPECNLENCNKEPQVITVTEKEVVKEFKLWPTILIVGIATAAISSAIYFTKQPQ